jgi:RNAse (barnase) inhibitor barstar
MQNLIFFKYYENIKEAYNAPGFLYADIPESITNEDGLMEIYAKIPWMPEYFGKNLNSLDECLRDVVFYPSSVNKIIHHDIPTFAQGDWVGYYLNVLNRAIQYLELHRELKNETKPPYASELIIYFPIKFKTEIEELIQKFGIGDIKARILQNEQDKQGILHWGEEIIKSGYWQQWRKKIGLPEKPE